MENCSKQGVLKIPWDINEVVVKIAFLPPRNGSIAGVIYIGEIIVFDIDFLLTTLLQNFGIIQ